MIDDARGNPPQPLILLANGDKWFLDSLESVLSQGGYRVVTANRRPIVLAKARELRPDAIILDLSLGVSLHGPAGDGFGLCRALRADSAVSPATPIVVTTAGPWSETPSERSRMIASGRSSRALASTMGRRLAVTTR